MNPVVNIALVIFGIIAIGVFPPLGLLMLIVAGASQKGHSNRGRRYRQAVAARQAQQERRARILAWKSL